MKVERTNGFCSRVKGKVKGSSLALQSKNWVLNLLGLEAYMRELSGWVQ